MYVDYTVCGWSWSAVSVDCALPIHTAHMFGCLHLFFTEPAYPWSNGRRCLSGRSKEADSTVQGETSRTDLSDITPLRDVRNATPTR